MLSENEWGKFVKMIMGPTCENDYGVNLSIDEPAKNPGGGGPIFEKILVKKISNFFPLICENLIGTQNQLQKIVGINHQHFAIFSQN